MAAGRGAWLLALICFSVGNALYFEVLKEGGKNDQLSNQFSLIRQKREWIVPPAVIQEGEDNSKKNPIARIRSDFEDFGMIITYKISGPGVTEPPYGLFVINKRTGELNITGIVDREQTPMFWLKGQAFDESGHELENALDLRIKVLDINDNFPVFSQEIFVGSVEELSEVGTLVMKINATDADDPTTPNAKIAFKIVQDASQPLPFHINKATGEVTAWLSLDREEKSSYHLTVEAKDRDGAGNAQQCTAQIKIVDVNDNLPVLEKEVYEGSVEENTANMEVMRIKVFDRDEEFSDNWLANFTITSGNEGGYFHIETDTQTNEGIVMLIKEINYEELQNIKMSIVVTNKAEFHKSIKNSYKAKSIPINIKVKNVPEGPVFKPNTLTIEANETMSINQIIATYRAYDEDTGKIAQHIKYAKSNDIYNWFNINSATAEITLIKVPDYELLSTVNGTYVVTVLAITDGFVKKTATGTIVLQVKDDNDNCPTIVNPEQTVCSNIQFINVTAVDRDAYPNSSPFTFSVIDEPEGMVNKWVIGSINETSIQLVPQNLKPGKSEVQLLVQDHQGFSCPEKQILKLSICTCVEGGSCRDALIGSSVVLGPGAIALIILALLLLLLVPLLLLLCHGRAGPKGFTAIPDSSEEMLRKWNSEGAAPEDKAVLNLVAPIATNSTALNMGSGAGAAMSAGAAAAGGGSSTSNMREHYSGINMGDGKWEEQRHLLSAAGYGAMAAGGTGIMAARGAEAMAAGRTMKMASGESMAMRAGEFMATGAGGTLNEEFLREYFNDKACSFAEEDEVQPAKDCLLLYSQEEAGSSHGSIGCCSFIENDLDDHFLDDLGDKFKILADICMGSIQHTPQVVQDRKSSPAVNASGLRLNDALPHLLDQQNAFSSEQTYASDGSFQLHDPVPRVSGLGSEAFTQKTVTETSYESRPGPQYITPVPDPVANRNVRVTETSYAAGPTVQPTTVMLDHPFDESVVVTERVLAPASHMQGMIEVPNLPHENNIVVTERLIKSDGTMPGVLQVQDFPDSQYVVVRERERLLVPSSELKGSLSIPSFSEGQNVVVSERVLTPSSGLQASYTMPIEVSGIQSAVSGVGSQEHVLISDHLLNHRGLNSEGTFPSSSPLSKTSKVTKYSTVQYTHS
ncbi:desmoglein-2 isoform X1 [Alligator mississippiensis]|uniref:desmoglein-2 isoform X1 n=1 Tax=Alligator mississippiensis TaxID=8496 RepID=UPI002877CF02|nr:desmoglein-2 isoform X1 [Alligator mississippiensis]